MQSGQVGDSFTDMRHLRSRAQGTATRRVGTLNLRAYPRPPGPEVPREVMTNELFAATLNARTENRRRFGRSISMDAIETALRQAYRGNMRNLTDILRETVETDPHLGSILNKRFGAVANLPWDVQPASGAGVDRDKAMFYAEVVRAQLRSMKSLRRNLAQLAWALFDGRACLELQWVELQPGFGMTSTQFGGTALALQEMDWIHPRRLSFGPERELRIHPETNGEAGNFAATGLDVRAIPDKFVWWMPQLFGEYPEREGLGIRCMYWSFFKRFAARERMILSELYGKPWRIITVDEESSAGKDELDSADEIVDALGSSYTARMPRGTSLQVVAPGRNAGQVHHEIIEESDKQNSKLVLGQTGTTDAVPAGLNSNQANVMQDEQLGVLIHDAAELSEVLESFVTDRIIAVNFGENEVTHAPTFRLRADLPADRVAELTRLDAALKAGLAVSRGEAYELSGFSIPDPDEVVIRMEQPPTPPNSPVAPAIRPMVVYPVGQSPDVGEQQPSAREAGAEAAADSTGAPAGAASAESTITVNEDRAARGLDPLTLPNGSPDPRGDLTIAEFNRTFEGTEEGGEGGTEPTAPAAPEPAKQAMNGAQITAVLDIVERYRSGSLPRQSAMELLVAIFPFSAQQANRILGPEIDEDAPPLAPPTPIAAAPEPPEDEEDEEDEDDAEPGMVLGLTRVRASAGEWENVAEEIAEGEYLYGEAGIHAHKVLRALETTELDGAHSHVFKLPDGTFVITQIDGVHMHGLPDVDADVTLEDGKHQHAVVMGGAVVFTGDSISAHQHSLQVMATAVDGAHRHTLEIPDPANPDRTITVRSMTAGEYARELREGTLPTIVDRYIPGRSASNDKKRKVYTEDDPVVVQLKIKKLPNGKYRVTKEDGTGNLGTYDTKAEAEKRLGEVEGFKERAATSAVFNMALDATMDFELSARLSAVCAEHKREMDEWNAWVAAGDPVDVQLELGQEQPGTPNGSPEDLVARGMRELLVQTKKWATSFESAVEDESTAVGLFGALQRAGQDLKVEQFGRVLERRKTQSLMLGVLDNVLEITTGDDAGETTVENVTEQGEELGATTEEIQQETSEVLDGLVTASKVTLAEEDAFTRKPFSEAVRFFKSLNVLDRPSFERATAAIKQRSFTVAGVVRDQMLRTLQDELAKAIAEGEDLRRFKRRVMPRLRAAGFIPELIGAPGRMKPALSASHIETVYRTNVLNTYNTGRFVHQSSPTVASAYPVWEFRAVRDARTRDTHKAVHGTRLLANDPFWQQAYPPYGYNCRCRVVSRSRRYLSNVVAGSTIRGLPDPGFTSGRPALALG